MKTEINATGTMIITAQTELESYAMQQWLAQNEIDCSGLGLMFVWELEE